MLNLQLFVEGQEVDLFDDESVTLTQSIQDVMDIEKVFTDFSRTFSVPASKTNNLIFKHFYNSNIKGFDARTKKDAELHLNYKLFKKGKIKLEGASTKDNKAHTYKLTFFGSTVTLKDLLGEDKLDALDYINEYFSFTYNNTNVKEYMENGLDITVGSDLFLDGIVFPLITHTKRLIYDSNFTSLNVNNETTNNIAYTNDPDYGLEISQLKPAIKVPAIIKAIESKYSITFSDDFFNTTNDPYSKLYLWLHNKTGAFSQDDDIPIGFATDIKVTNFDGGQEYLELTPGAFVLKGAPAKGFDVVVTPATNNPFNVVIYKDGIEFKRWDNVALNYTNNTEWSLKVENNGNIEGQVLGTYKIAIESETANNFDLRIQVNVNTQKTLESNPEIRLSASASVGTNVEVYPSRFMPDMKVIDFLTGIFKMFNLTAFLNESGTVVVKTLDDFYEDSTTTWDITEFIDKSSQDVTSIIPYKQVDFSYKGTSNFFAKAHEEQNKIKWGELKYNVSEKYEGNIYKIELPFEHFKYERLYNVNGGSATEIVWGWSADIKQQASIGEPLLFYPIKHTLDMGIVDLNGAVSQKTSAYIPSNSLNLTDSFNIHFNAEYNEYITSKIFDATLFDTYYKNYIIEIFDQQKRLLKTKAYLPISMLSQFTLADKIRIFNNLFRINKITTNFETLQSDLELINAKDTFGEQVIVDAILPSKFDLTEKCITVDDMTSIGDLYYASADFYCEVDDFLISSTNEIIPSDLAVKNTPEYVQFDESIIVTQATLADVSPIVVTSSSIYLSHEIVDMGLVGIIKQWHEYGFFYSSNSSDLDSTDVDTLKANSNVTNIHFESTVFNRMVPPGIVTAKVDGLSSSQTIYWRFYVRTNTNPSYKTADAFSDKKTSTTL